MNIRFLHPTLLALILSVSGTPVVAKEFADEAGNREAVSTLEGVLKVHPKFLFNYFITGFGDGQACALLGDDKLKDIRAGSLVRVKGAPFILLYSDISIIIAIRNACICGGRRM